MQVQQLMKVISAEGTEFSGNGATSALIINMPDDTTVKGSKKVFNSVEALFKMQQGQVKGFQIVPPMVVKLEYQDYLIYVV